MKPEAQFNNTVNIIVSGIVQGVGFRPFIFKLATELELKGTVANTEKGVLITAQGPLQLLELFIKRIRQEAPPMSKINNIASQAIDHPTPFTYFSIVESRQKDKASVPITPDIAMCNDCRKEITDPDDRRYQYPFTNCTNCGPRFSIVKKVPYDRPFTSMHCFTMCRACDNEYHNPLDRRFHAQPNACPDCGPSLTLADQSGKQLHTNDCIADTVRALAEHKIAAIKGLGGFHLAANALSEKAVATLRQRKNRPAKPLAIMVRDLAAAKKYCTISRAEEKLLCSPQSPIVLLAKKRQATDLAENLAEGMQILGVMLAYTPLHYLLLSHPDCPDALVMTSGNFSNQPICTENEDAIARLGALADLFLLHNRDIVTRVDDSVARVMNGRPHLIRRARGYTPSPIPLPEPAIDTLACGGEMKNTFCIVRNNEAYISQHIGEMDSPETLDFFTESVEHLSSVLQFTPRLTVHDLHPDYRSTRYAKLVDSPNTGVQHHHAHTGAVMAEHGLTGPCISIVLDGTGYGEDGTIWGGEIYLTDRTAYKRVGHLEPFQLPGGDQAAKEPWRSAFSLLYRHGSPDLLHQNLPVSLATVKESSRSTIRQMLEKNVNTPLTSSCGRLFDAISALLGFCLYSKHEGHAAMLLESRASTTMDDPAHRGAESALPYRVELRREGGMFIVPVSTLLEAILLDLRQKTAVESIACRFHQWLIDSLALLATSLGQETGLRKVALCGGCMQNRLLLEGITNKLTISGYDVFSSEMVPVNDGGLSLGQAYIGSAGNKSRIMPSQTDHEPQAYSDDMEGKIICV